MFKGFKVFASSLVALSLCLLSGCKDEKKQDETLVFGISADYPPFEYIDNGKIVGFDIDLASEIAKKMGKQAEFKNLSIGVVLVSLQNKTIDAAISALGSTAERLKNYDFSTPYYKEAISIVYRKENPIQVAELMEGKKIVGQLGTIPEKWLKEKTKAEVISMDNMNAAVESLKAGQVDGVVLNTMVAKTFVKKNQELAFFVVEEDSTEGYAIAFAKNSPFTQEVNKILKNMEESGELGKLRDKWGLGD